METTFDPLKALSEARTALDDPGGVGLEDQDWDVCADYAVMKIDQVIGSLYLEPGGRNDYRGEARWVLTHLGRMLAATADTLEEGCGRASASEEEAAELLTAAGDIIDQAIEAIS